MDGTPGTPQLFANIQFDEAKKGYDRDQVRNFLSELSTKIGELQDMLREATVRAESAEAKAAEATKAKVLAETMADKAKADAAKVEGRPTSEPVNEVEAAAGMLALAQQTAEAAIAAAESRAKDVLADARSKAAMIVVEVEQEVERIKARASEDADALVTGRADDIEAEVRRLESRRDGLQNDVHVLQSHLDEHRQRLRDGVDALAKLLDDGGFDPIDGGDGGSGSKPSASIFDGPAADDATIDVTDNASVTAEADPSSAPIADSDETAAAADRDEAAVVGVAGRDADATDRDAATDGDSIVPVIEFVPEPEPAITPALDLVAAMTARETLAAPHADPPEPATDADAAPESADDERRPTAELTIFTVEDLATANAVEDSLFAPSARVDPESERRAAQIPSLLEAPDIVVLPQPGAVTDAPAADAAAPLATEALEAVVAAAPGEADSLIGTEPEWASAPASDTDDEPEPVESAQPVVQPVAEARPLVVAATGTDGVGSPSKPVINLTAAKLFGEPVVEGDPTQAFDVLADDMPVPRLTLQRTTPAPTGGEQSPLGEPDADADAAMRAFFEQDLAKLERDQPRSGRFRRK